MSNFNIVEVWAHGWLHLSHSVKKITGWGFLILMPVLILSLALRFTAFVKGKMTT